MLRPLSLLVCLLAAILLLAAHTQAQQEVTSSSFVETRSTISTAFGESVHRTPAQGRARKFSSGGQSKRYANKIAPAKPLGPTPYALQKSPVPARGWGISPVAPRRIQQRLPSPRLTGAASLLTRANVKCVLCQYVVQKLAAGLNAAATGAAVVPAGKPVVTDMAENPTPVSLMEVFASMSAENQARVQAHVAAEATADAKAQAIPTLFDRSNDPARRFRHTDRLAARPTYSRFAQVKNGGRATAENKAQHAAYMQLYSSVYASFENLCASEMPLAYLPYCNDMLKSYRFIAQAINYGDRPDQACMSANFCDHRSYVRQVTHATYQREPGDA